MAESDQGEKTEEATQQRRDDFRKRGQVAQTRELASLLMLLAAVTMIWFLSQFFFDQVYQIFTRSFGDFVVTGARETFSVLPIKFAITKTFFVIAPVMGILGLVSFASSVVQVGFLTNEEAMQLKFERLDPVQGLKRVFSLKSLVEGIKAVVKVSIIGSIAAVIIKAELLEVPYLIHYSVGQVFEYVGDTTVKLFGGVGAFMFLLATLDYFFQKWDLEQKMRMTKQEVKEELKSREGDPLIKARIRRTQREMANRRMMEDVPKADVIITNPTHIAVAIKYSAEMIAPTMVAKGAESVAEKIKEIARENKIPIVENKPLARTMFKTLKIGMAVPRELYTAVAEVLSYIYKLRGKGKRI